MLITSLAVGLGTTTFLAKVYLNRKKKRTNRLRKRTPALPTQNPQPLDQGVQAANKGMMISAASMSLAIGSKFFFPPLRLLAWSGLAVASAHFFKGAYQAAVKERKLNMAFIDGLMMTGVFVTGSLVGGTLMCFLIYLAQKLLLKTEDRSMKNLVSIFGEQPRTVWVLKNGVEIEIDFEQLRAGDVIVINAGEVIAADGSIISGVASIDEHTLTGESQPAEKTIGDSVFAATIVLAGRIQIEVKKAGSDSVAAQIGTLLAETADYKTTTENRWVKFADKTAPVTLGASLGTLAALGPASAFYMLYACSYGYSMRVIAPATMLNFLSLSSQNGLLIKDGRSLDLLSKVDTVVFDKTGTLTMDQPVAGQIHTCHDVSEETLLFYAAAAEYRQTHPLARAILLAAEQRGLKMPDVDEAQYQMGYGIKAHIDNKVVHLGSARFMDMEGIPVSTELASIQQQAHENGTSLVMVAVDNQLAGAIELQVALRPEAQAVINELRQRNIEMCIISGDHEKPTKHLAQALGIKKYFAETLPENKAKLVAQLQNSGKSVCFIGDGINDAIALKQANVSISMSGATTVATDTAQIVLMDGSLKQLVTLFEIAKNYNHNVKRSLGITLLPTTAAVTGVLFFNIGIAASVILYSSGLAIGMCNATLPVWKKITGKKSALQ